MDKLAFISDIDLYSIVKKFISDFEKIQREAPSKFEKSELDPFSAILFSVCSGTNLNVWKHHELTRQIGKSFQNKIGDFHQEILGACHGWENIDDVIDVANSQKRIVAEIKNKYNTTKGSDKKSLYDNLASVLSKPEYSRFTGYYVEIIPRERRRYNYEFTPSDNLTHGNRIARPDIRVVDGYTFYQIATDRPDAIRELYEVLPNIVEEITGENTNIKDSSLFFEIFNKTFE